MKEDDLNLPAIGTQLLTAPGKLGITAAEQRPCKIHFCAGGAVPILTITHDGRLERGPGFRTDDEASVAFFDCLSRAFPSFLSDLRQRAEDAERELAALKAPSTGAAD